jgi:STE24 endopeptidase
MKKIVILIIVVVGFFGTIKSEELVPDTLNVAQTEIQNFNADAATQNYLNTMSPEEKEKSDAYFEGGYWLMIVGLIMEIIVAWIFLSLGLSKWIKKIATRFKKINLQNLAYAFMYLLFAYILSFPLNIYTSFFREHKFDLSNMTFGEWLSEDLIGLAMMIVVGSLLLMALYIAIRKVQKSWWIWGSAILTLFLILAMFVSPIFISPIFNDYKPLEEGEVRDEILSMARANGVPADNVYMFDASKQSSRISANVSGLGSTIRISLNDNLLNQCSIEEIKAVMAHELGHYVLNHIYEMIIYFGLIIFIGFAFINWLFKKVIHKYGDKWGVNSIADIGGLPLFIFLFSFYFFIATPVTNNIIRSNEVEADYFGLNTAREPDGFASVAMKLSTYRKINPGKWEEIIFFDHPSGNTRVSTAMKWKAENLKE